MKHTVLRASRDQLREMTTRRMAWYSTPGSGYAWIGHGPSFHNDVRLAGPEDFATADELAAAADHIFFSLVVDLPDYSLSS